MTTAEVERLIEAINRQTDRFEHWHRQTVEIDRAGLELSRASQEWMKGLVAARQEQARQVTDAAIRNAAVRLVEAIRAGCPNELVGDREFDRAYQALARLLVE